MRGTMRLSDHAPPGDSVCNTHMRPLVDRLVPLRQGEAHRVYSLAVNRSRAKWAVKLAVNSGADPSLTSRPVGDETEFFVPTGPDDPRLVIGAWAGSGARGTPRRRRFIDSKPFPEQHS